VLRYGLGKKHMGLLDFFRRPAPIDDLSRLADFIDKNAAFLVQKGIYEYSRARAGHYAKVLLTESGFLKAVDEARWKAYPLGLAMVGEMVEGVLRAAAGDDHRPVLDALSAVVFDVFDRYPVPESIGAAAWQVSRADLGRRLGLVGLHPPKPVKDIPEPFAQAYFELMPIDKRLRAADAGSIRNYLRVSLINVHERLVQRLDAPAVVAALRPPVQ
jgi:hypothetical protein